MVRQITFPFLSSFLFLARKRDKGRKERREKGIDGEERRNERRDLSHRLTFLSLLSPYHLFLSLFSSHLHSIPSRSLSMNQREEKWNEEMGDTERRERKEGNEWRAYLLSFLPCNHLLDTRQGKD